MPYHTEEVKQLWVTFIYLGTTAGWLYGVEDEPYIEAFIVQVARTTVPEDFPSG